MGSLLTCGTGPTRMGDFKSPSLMNLSSYVDSMLMCMYLRLDRLAKCRTIQWNLRAPSPVPPDLTITPAYKEGEATL